MKNHLDCFTPSLPFLPILVANDDERAAELVESDAAWKRRHLQPQSDSAAAETTRMAAD